MSLFRRLRNLLWNKTHNVRPIRATRARHHLPLYLERLEDRTLPSVVNWINPGGGDWNTASNWSTGALPGASDDVVINHAGITVTHSASNADSVHGLVSQ